ncbi:Hypothetical protein NTJ_15798 [Nesidiocoris tenuis]|uniref:Uncharacterized protein n=1 Tax=Nesidiocoris tenuis TaxID=355587 RepID=A0ABN7BGH6_9HEMI|nr:Hypothetical protein NTJ_15798 [Nesidiocoris tenuis]
MHELPMSPRLNVIICPVHIIRNVPLIWVTYVIITLLYEITTSKTRATKDVHLKIGTRSLADPVARTGAPDDAEIQNSTGFIS